MNNRHTQLIVTLGPATCTEQDLRTIKGKGVNFVRVNMSHSSIEDLHYFVDLSKRVGIPFMLDTEGSQIRTGCLADGSHEFKENELVIIRAADACENPDEICLRPGHVVEQLEVGDLVHVDFDTLILRIIDVDTRAQGYVTAKAISGGRIGSNKAVVVDPMFDKRFELPAISPKDHEAIALGLREGIEHIAVSFVRSGESIEEVRRVTNNKMKIISKVECTDALEHINDIIHRSDFLLLDRGDLSKEIPIEKIPFTQKVIIQKARRYNKGVFVATNLLESMVEKRNPTRAEVHDVVNTIVDGALGLVMAAETAIGKHPMECLNMLNRLIQHVEGVMNGSRSDALDNRFIRGLECSPYLNVKISSSLTPPHGGKLVNRVLAKAPDARHLAAMPKVRLDHKKQMDVEQIAVGAYSPLKGFLGQEDFLSVVSNMRLANGIVWPLPIVLDVSDEVADHLTPGETVGLTDENDEVVALLHLTEKYRYDKQDMIVNVYGTDSLEHPGVRAAHAMQPVLLAGPIDVIRGRRSPTRAYELSPRQLRRLFEDRGWSTVLGFHTRNVPHRGHEFIQLKVLKDETCDGLLVQPVVGQKKPGDYRPEYIIRCYEKLIEEYYPKEKVVLAAFATYSRYAGPREAVFTALCRKNCGCSHFIVGRDHTGVGNWYDPYASQRIFDEFPDLGITVVKCGEFSYSPALDSYVPTNGTSTNGARTNGASTNGMRMNRATNGAATNGATANGHGESLQLISGSEARAMFVDGQRPPSWFMRPEVSQIVLAALANGEDVFENEQQRV